TTSYNHASTGSNQDRHLQAAGAGSVLDLSGVTSVTNGTNFGNHIYVDALDGGLVDLSAVTQINDGSGGDTRVRAVLITANGGTAAPSTVKLSALTTFSDVNAGDVNLGGDTAFSRLDAYSGGVLQTPALTRLTGVYIGRDAASSVNTAQITD